MVFAGIGASNVGPSNPSARAATPRHAAYRVVRRADRARIAALPRRNRARAPFRAAARLTDSGSALRPVGPPTGAPGDPITRSPESERFRANCKRRRFPLAYRPTVPYGKGTMKTATSSAAAPSPRLVATIRAHALGHDGPEDRRYLDNARIYCNGNRRRRQILAAAFRAAGLEPMSNSRKEQGVPSAWRLTGGRAFVLL